MGDTTAEIDFSDDLAVRELKSTISKPKGNERAFLKHLLRDYTRFKNSPGSAVSSSVLQCWTFQEGPRDNIIHSRTSAGHADVCCAKLFDKVQLMADKWIVRPLSVPLSQYYHSICSRCVQTDCECCTFALRLLPAWGVIRTRILRAIFLKAVAGNEKDFFSDRFKIIATLRGRLRSLPLALNNYFAFLVVQSLKIPRPSLNLALHFSIHDKRRKLLQPPSRSGSSPIFNGPSNRECF